MELFVLGGGLGASLAFLVGLAFARTALSLIALATIGTFAVLIWHVLAPPTEIMNVTANMNLLGWLGGTLLAARLRALEYLNAQEAA